MRHNIHAGYQQSVDSEDLTRSSNGWGIDHRARRRAPASRARRSSTSRRSSSRARQRVPTIHSEFRSKSIEVNDTINWKNWTFNVGLLASQRHAVRPGAEQRRRRRCRAIVLATGDRRRRRAVQDVRDAVQQDDPAAPQRDLGLQRQGHGLRQLRALQPGGELAAARGVVGSQPRDDDPGLLRRQRHPVRHRPAGVLVRASCSCRT